MVSPNRLVGCPAGHKTSGSEALDVLGVLLLSSDGPVDETVRCDAIRVCEHFDALSTIGNLVDSEHPSGGGVVPEGNAVQQCVRHIVFGSSAVCEVEVEKPDGPLA